MRVPLYGSMNFFWIHVALGILLVTIAVIALFALFTQRNLLIRLSGWFSLGLTVFIFMAAKWKVADSFAFIPLKKLATLATGIVHFSWGWLVLLTGAVLLIIAGKTNETSVQKSVTNPQ
ncbi:hypothetical protein Solca_3114 [Solitalea canadensis DSM 3403]|uniref:Uncharacterized protein n=2 Tax=Solitalea canadensis TaxID=995 RepID=H8KWK9_SOLCM|nr:hypothetical protein Solca_3114 [Solitalea canadensis DSM 3403]